MKLQKQVAYKYKDKIHYKYVIVVPERIIRELGWKDGQELTLNVLDSRLTIETEKATLE
jgi:bifunctional DNA-binding transcriptional regulator/antitoxin component of YhaV-PrlF toxin-antitoxin module